MVVPYYRWYLVVGAGASPTYLRNGFSRRVIAVNTCRAIWIENVRCQILIESFELGILFENGGVARGNHVVKREWRFTAGEQQEISRDDIQTSQLDQLG